MTTTWLRYDHGGQTGFGTLHHDLIDVYDGDMFRHPRRTGRQLEFGEVRILAPVVPGKVLGLWNNFHALGRKLELQPPAEPLYFLKTPNTLLNPNDTIPRPRGVSGKTVFEGELGIVIGARAKAVNQAEAARCIFGYTCVNDLGVFDLIGRDPTFAQWTRAKGFDGFCPIGPVIVNGLDPATLVVRSLLDGVERQNYPISDMVFPAARLVSLISQDMTLEPGDVISCGTSVGAGALKPGSRIEIHIDGIGSLVNHFEGN